MYVMLHFSVAFLITHLLLLLWLFYYSLAIYFVHLEKINYNRAAFNDTWDKNRFFYFVYVQANMFGLFTAVEERKIGKFLGKSSENSWD